MLCAEAADDGEGEKVLLSLLEDWVGGQFVGIEQPFSRGTVFVQQDCLGDEDGALQRFFEEKEVQTAVV